MWSDPEVDATVAGEVSGDVCLQGGPGGLRLVADNRLHHEGVLEVADVVALLGVSLVDA